MYGAIGGGLPPGVTISMIPGNRPEDIEAERVVEALEERLSRAIRDGELPDWTTIDNLWHDLERVKWEWAGEHVSPDEIAEETLQRYMERKTEDEGEEVA